MRTIHLPEYKFMNRMKDIEEKRQMSSTAFRPFVFSISGDAGGQLISSTARR